MSTYKLKYNDYFKNVTDGLRSMLATADITDVTLAVEGKYFRAHQMVLSIFSSYFKELFSANPCKHPIFFIKDVKYQIMKDLLTFMYEGMVQIAEEDFDAFVDTAKALQVKGLTNVGELPCKYDTRVEASDNKKTNHGKEQAYVRDTQLDMENRLSSKRPHESSQIAPDSPLLQSEHEAHVRSIAKKSKHVKQASTPILSEVSVLPLTGSCANWKPNAQVVDEEADLMPVNIQEPNIVLNTMETSEIISDATEIDETEYKENEGTIDLENDMDECDMKPEEDCNIDILQDDDDDDLEILGEGAVEGEPVVVTFVQTRKGRSLIANNYRYCIGDQSNYWTTWRCTKRRSQNQENCRAVVCITRDNRLVFKNAHNHEAPGPDPFLGALAVQPRTCKLSTMAQLNQWRCNMQQSKNDIQLFS